MLYQPNDADDPRMDNELAIGTEVRWVGEDGKPEPTVLKIFRIGSSAMTFDYGVETPSGNRFYHRKWELCLPDGSAIE